MILGFKGQLASDIFFGRSTSRTKKFDAQLIKIALRKLQYINAAKAIYDLRVPPGNRLEALRGDLKGYYSIRINDQWRIVFTWKDGASNVEIVDYH